MNHHSTSTTDDICNDRTLSESAISYEDERFGALRILIWFLGGAPKKPQRSAPLKAVKAEVPNFANEAHSIIHPAHVS